MSKKCKERGRKILHIVGDSKFGGGSVIILSLSHMAKQHGWDVDILSTDDVYCQVIQENGLRAITLPVIWRDCCLTRDILGLFRLIYFLRTSSYSIVHTHTSKGGFIGRLAAKVAGIPIIVHTAHGFAFHEFSSIATLQFYAALERMAAHWCDKIITVSNFHREWALKLKIAPPEKIVAIQNGISADRLKVTCPFHQVRAELGVSSEETLIVTFGRLAPQKGLEYLIRSLPYVINQASNRVKVILVGEGPLRTYLEALALSTGVSSHVRFIGFRKDIADILNAADIVVLPSLREGLSVALLEAMAMAKPIVTTAIGSNKEVIEHGKTGLLVPPRDPCAIAQAIISLLSNRNLRMRLGAASKETFKAKFTEDKMLKQTWEAYSQLISRKLPHLASIAYKQAPTKAISE